MNITRGTILTTLPWIGRQFSISFDFNPYEYGTGDVYASVIHFSQSDLQFVSRIPGVWFHPHLGMHISSAISGNSHNNYDTNLTPVLNRWTQFVISQRLENSQYIFRIVIDGNEVRMVENTQPEIFTDVKVYISDPWYVEQPGMIRNIVVASPADTTTTSSAGITECRNIIQMLLTILISKLLSKSRLTVVLLQLRFDDCRCQQQTMTNKQQLLDP